MQKTHTFENFPARIVLLSTLFSWSIYVLGVIILAALAAWLVVVYVVLCLALEYRLLKTGCTNCYYYGKICGFGKGKVCSWLFKPGNDPQWLGTKTVSWKEILPDFLVVLVPLVGGIVLLVHDFNWLVVLALAVLVILSTGGNAVIRSSFACKYCKQREIGCPAEKLFSGSGEASKS